MAGDGAAAAAPATTSRRRRGGRDRTGVYRRIRADPPVGSPSRQRPRPREPVVPSRRMPIPRRYTTDAIVLSRFDLGEADRVLTLITPTGGKLKAIAKGVRRPTSRLGGSLEPFAELTVGARPRPDVRRRHPGQRRARLAEPARLARIGRDRLVPRRARRPLARGAPRRRAAVRAAAPRLRAARRRDGARSGRALVRDAPARRARPAARGRPLRRVRPGPRGRRALPLGAAARRRPVRALPGPAARPDRDLARGAQAAQGLPAPRHRGDRRRCAWRPTSSARPRPRCATSCAIALERDARSLAFLDEVRTRAIGRAAAGGDGAGGRRSPPSASPRAASAAARRRGSAAGRWSAAPRRACA